MITTSLPTSLYRAVQTREMDRIAIEEGHIPGQELMERAGGAAFNLMCDLWPQARNIVVVCGNGNNGGDGFVVARRAQQAGFRVRVLVIAPDERFSPDALVAAESLKKIGVEWEAFSATACAGADLIVDAILGTGLIRPVMGVWQQAIESIHHAAIPVFSLDIPSGLHADTGRVLGYAIQAQATLTFIGVKQGLLTAAGPDHCGRLYYDDLDLSPALYTTIKPAALRLTPKDLALARRRRGAHKGNHGRVLVIGGDQGMGGAVIMAALAALRSGAGLVKVATHVDYAAGISIAYPEIMAYGIKQVTDIDALVENTDVIAFGPGLGQSGWSRQIFNHIRHKKIPMVLDADGLNLLAIFKMRQNHWILTPHPGEAARLLNTDSAQIQADRFAAVTKLQAEYGGVVVLKGVGTLICDAQVNIYLCDRGNPGMATAGMGDLLSGVIAGLLAQGLSTTQAAYKGVLIHALAGDEAAALHGERGLTALDVLLPIRRWVNQVHANP